MTDAELVAIRLGRAYGLQAQRFLDASAFLGAVAAAIKVVTADQIVEMVSEQGPLTGLNNPYGGLIARIRNIPADIAVRRRLASDEIERERFAAFGRAARRGETLAELVNRGDLDPEEAQTLVRAEYLDQELLDVALDAVRGRLA